MSGNADNKEWLYFLNIKTSSIIKMHKESGDLKTIISGLRGTPDGIQVDHANELIYWTNMGRDYNQRDGSIEVCDFNGTHLRQLVGDGAITTPKQLYLDKRHELLYWCDREGGKVMRCRTDGAHCQTLVDRSQSKSGTVDILDQCVGITIDPVCNKFYWTQKGPSKGNKGRIFRANLELPVGETPANRQDIELLYDGLPEPIDLEIDVEHRHLYWTDRGAPPNGNSLNCASVSPTGLAQQRVICRGFNEAIGLALEIKQRRVYVADLGGMISRVDLVSGDKQAIYCQGSLTGITC